MQNPAACPPLQQHLRELAAMRADLMLPYGCRNGACGSCKGKILAGEVDYGPHQASTLTEEEKRQGLALFCCAKPRTDLVIEVREVRRAGDITIKRLPCRIESIVTAGESSERFTTRAGTMVAGAHAGWRSLVSGILEKTVAAMAQAGAERTDILVWLGPAIGPMQFEVGAEVREAFIEAGRALGISAEQTDACFVARSNDGNASQKYLADIYALARQRLQCAGLHATQISGGGLCTVSDAQRFYSYRRDGTTGRMASLIWWE